MTEKKTPPTETTVPVGSQDAPVGPSTAYPPSPASTTDADTGTQTTLPTEQHIPPIADGTAYPQQPDSDAVDATQTPSTDDAANSAPSDSDAIQLTQTACSNDAVHATQTPSTAQDQPDTSSTADDVPTQCEQQSAPPIASDVGKQHSPEPTQPAIRRTLRLPNARQNQPYEAMLDEVMRQEWVNVTLGEDDGTGLQLHKDGVVRLSGTPVNNGERRLQLRGQYPDGTPVVLIMELLINPDPKTLWNTIEPSSPLFRKPHQAYLHHADAQVRLTAARVRGRSHAHKGSFCEDDIAILLDGEQTGYLGMVADGAGSSRYSRLASQVLCDSVPRHLKREVQTLHDNGELEKLYAALDGTDNQRQAGLHAAGSILANAVKRSFQDIMTHSGMVLRDEHQQQHQITIKDLYTTCLVFWALPLSAKRWLLASYWVGDGGLAVEHGDGFTLLGIPDGGEFSGQTRFLNSEEISDAALGKRLRTAIYSDLRSVWAMTDGITDAKFASEQQLERSEAWQAVTEDIIPSLGSAEALYEWLGFWSQGNHDDRSVCVLQVLGGSE